MDKITFFHCADLHLDTPFTTLASKTGLPSQRRKNIFSSLARLIENVKNAKPDFLFIAGDLFEHEYTGLRTISAVNSLFASIPDTRIILISGNHDPEAANSFYKTYTWHNNVYFINGETESVFFEDKNIEIFGLGWGPGYGQNAKLETMSINKEHINILLFHGDIDIQIGTRDYNSVSAHRLQAIGFDYIAAGHNHKRKDGECGGIFDNPGSLEPLGFDEPGIHGYFTGHIKKGESSSVSFVENSVNEYITIELDVSDFESDTHTLTALKPMLNTENTFYKVVLTGNKKLDYNPDISFLESELSPITQFVKVADNSRIAITLDELSRMKGLKGIFSRHLMEQMEAADDEEKIILEKALYYGIEAIDNGKIERAGGEEL